MSSSDAYPTTFFLVAAPFPHVISCANVMPSLAVPPMITYVHPYSVPTCAPQENVETSQADMTGAVSILGKVWDLCQEQESCLDVQKLLDESSESDRIAIATELRGHIWDASQHPSANFAVQKCIETMRPEAVQFIIDELMSNDCLHNVAMHKFGCRIVQRLLEYCRPDQVHTLTQHLLSEALALAKNNYGIYVIRHLLDYACIEHQRYLVELFIEHAPELCCTNISCTAIDVILADYDGDRVRLANVILKHNLLGKMGRSRHGHVAVKTVMKILEGSLEYGAARKQLLASKDALSKTRYGRSLLRELGDEVESDMRTASESSKDLQQDGAAVHRLSWADITLETKDELKYVSG